MIDKKPPRGRPKTLKRQDVLQTAMAAYWDAGPTAVSIGEICAMAGVSKPGLYREFGSDDGLKAAVLDHYHDVVLAEMYRVLSSDKPFSEVVEDFINFVVQDRHAIGVPPGCLQVSMRASHGELGVVTARKVDELRQKTLGAYRELIERAKVSGDLDPDLATEVTALFFDALNIGAMRMQKEGVPDETIKAVLRQAFSALS